MSVWLLTTQTPTTTTQSRVSIVNDYFNLEKEKLTKLTKNASLYYRKRLLTERNYQAKKVFGYASTPKSTYLKKKKLCYLMKKLRVQIVNDYVDTRFSKFAIEYLHENAKVEKLICLFI